MTIHRCGRHLQQWNVYPQIFRTNHFRPLSLCDLALVVIATSYAFAAAWSREEREQIRARVLHTSCARAMLVLWEDRSLNAGTEVRCED